MAIAAQINYMGLRKSTPLATGFKVADMPRASSRWGSERSLLQMEKVGRQEAGVPTT